MSIAWRELKGVWYGQGEGFDDLLSRKLCEQCTNGRRRGKADEKKMDRVVSR